MGEDMHCNEFNRISKSQLKYINAALYARQHVQCNPLGTIFSQGHCPKGVTLDLLPSIQGSIYYLIGERDANTYDYLL